MMNILITKQPSATRTNCHFDMGSFGWMRVRV